MEQPILTTNETLENCIERANKLRQEGKLDEAIALYQRAIEIDPTSCHPYHYMGETLAQKGDLDGAANFYNIALEINPDFFWSYHCLGLVFSWQGKLGDAILSARQAIDLKPEQALFHYQLGCYLERELELDSAITAYSKALDIEPNLTEAHHHLEALLIKQTKLAKNLSNRDTIKDIDDENSNLENLISQGKELVDRGEIEKAISIYQQAIELDINSYKCYYYLGKALAKKNELEEAEACYCQAINLNPEHYWSYYNLGQVLLWQSKLDKAISAFQKAIQLDPDKAVFRIQLGQTFAKKEELDKAINCYQKAIELQPSNDQVYYYLGEIFIEQQRWEEVVRLYSSYANEFNADFLAYYNLGEALSNLNRWQEAINAYQKADKLEPQRIEVRQKLESAAIWQQLGLELYNKEDVEGAIAAYTKAIEIDPEQPVWIYCILIEKLREQSKSKESTKIALKGLKQYPNEAQISRQFARTLKYQEEYDKAEKLLTFLVEEKKDPWLIRELVEVQELQNKLKSALKNIQIANELSSDNCWLKWDLARLLKKNGQSESAIIELLLLTRMPNTPTWLRVNIYKSLGELLEDEDKSESNFYYARAFQLDRNNLDLKNKALDALQNLAKDISDLHFRYHSWEESYKIYSWLCNLNPDDHEAHFRLGNTLEKLEQQEKALQEYEICVQLKPNRVEYLEKLGDLLSRQGGVYSFAELSFP